MLLDGRAPRPGEIMRFPDLAETFKLLASEGKDGFYKGRVAEAIVELVKSGGGAMELADLANHRSTFVDPISYTYQKGDVTIWEVQSLRFLFPHEARRVLTIFSISGRLSVRRTGKVSRL